MTISVTSTHHALMVAWARHDIEALTGPTPSRERAGRVLREWHSYAGMTGAEIADVLASYYPEEPVMVAGRDYLVPEHVPLDAELALKFLDQPAPIKTLVEVTDEPTAVAS